MRLAGKTFLYSVVISLIVGLTIFAYMFFLLPSMYMDYKQKEHFDDAKSAINELKDRGSLSKLKETDNRAFGFVIPKEGNKIKISGRGFDGTVEITSGNGSILLDKVRSLNNMKSDSYSLAKENFKKEKFEKEVEPILKGISNELAESLNSTVKIDIKDTADLTKFKTKSEKFHRLDKNSMIGEFSVEQENSGTEYSTYLGISMQGKDIYIIVYTAVTPRATEIIPVIVRAIPMIILMMILMAFGVSAIYSKKIVNPISKLSKDAERRIIENSYEFDSIEIDGKDEIAELAKSLNRLYAKQAESMAMLEADNQRQEIFMRAASHQLKTPIAASLLLTDGMISNVGKFSDRDEYLLKLKGQLKEMRKMVDEILGISYVARNLELISIDMLELCREVIGKNLIHAESCEIKIELKEDNGKIFWQGSRELLEKIIDNLISNGIIHSKRGGWIKIIVRKNMLIIKNSPAHIDEHILDNIFDPFVTSAVKKSEDGMEGHGLGLYVAKYLAESMGFSLEAENMENEVKFILER